MKNFLCCNEKQQKRFRIFWTLSIICYLAALAMLAVSAAAIPGYQSGDIFEEIGFGLLVCGGLSAGIAGLCQNDIPGIAEKRAVSQEEFEELLYQAKKMSELLKNNENF